MDKKVNIYPRWTITGVNPPIRIPVRNVTKDIKDIRKCILAGARVEEITPNGIVLLNLQNYDIDNGSGEGVVKASKPITKEDPTISAPVNRPEALQKKFDDIEKRAEEVKKIEEENQRKFEYFSAKEALENAEAAGEVVQETESTVDPEDDNTEAVTPTTLDVIVDEQAHADGEENITIPADPDEVPVEEEPVKQQPRQSYSKKYRKALQKARELNKNSESDSPVETVDAEDENA